MQTISLCQKRPYFSFATSNYQALVLDCIHPSPNIFSMDIMRLTDNNILICRLLIWPWPLFVIIVIQWVCSKIMNCSVFCSPVITGEHLKQNRDKERMRTVIDQMGTKSVFMSGNYRRFPRSSASWMDDGRDQCSAVQQAAMIRFVYC